VPRRYFTDRDLGQYQLPNVLRDAGFEVVRHCELFVHDAPDEEWLEYCGTNGLVAITHNSRIRYTPNQRKAVEDHRVSLVILTSHATTRELGHLVVRSREKIEELLALHPPPVILTVGRPDAKELRSNPDAPGKVEVWPKPKVKKR
jgi:hypothetical protein